MYEEYDSVLFFFFFFSPVALGFFSDFFAGVFFAGGMLIEFDDVQLCSEFRGRHTKSGREPSAAGSAREFCLPPPPAGDGAAQRRRRCAPSNRRSEWRLADDDAPSLHTVRSLPRRDRRWASAEPHTAPAVPNLRGGHPHKRARASRTHSAHTLLTATPRPLYDQASDTTVDARDASPFPSRQASPNGQR